MILSRQHVSLRQRYEGPRAFYETALARYKKVSYDKLHDFIEEGLVDWYKRFKPDAARSEDEEGAEEVEVNGEEQVDEAVAGPAVESIAFSLKRKSTGAPAVAAAPSAAAAEAGAAGPAAAATGPTDPAAAAVGSKK